ncbi:class I SAM-dependent methyltransferase [Actinomadura soli]|uniref:Class I SAM-dependent methyltransferase n=1 Tax=Actinomadura soli TaxID=2508997 RepID=A0A5C4JDP3_9ACTN|nr:class I SAM-dependent methyltransferase [Actinomadura soli]TMR02603.1 class I SAM-dependent methyltransferase [Actinomadura soli]
MNREDQVLAEDTSAFEPLYAGKAPIEGLGMRFGFAPWDIGEPQRSVMDLERAGGFTGPVLDAGCGRGAHAVYLSGRGYPVTGVDISPTAIDDARERARAQNADVEFMVADATRMDGVREGFRSVLDYGLYHCLDDDQRRVYAATVHRLCAEGATLQLFSFSETAPPGLPPAWLRVGRANLEANLSEHWRIIEIRETSSATRFTRAFLEEKRDAAPEGGVEFDPDALDEDDQGRILLPMWHVHAERV